MNSAQCAAYLICICLISGCHSTGSVIPVAWDREISVRADTALAPSWPGPEHGVVNTVSAPYHIFVSADVDSSSSDPVKYWTKAELDLDDGEGWRDVTSQVYYHWKHGWLSSAGYLELTLGPGDYHIRARGTYYDGEILESEPRTEIMLHVVP